MFLKKWAGGFGFDGPDCNRKPRTNDGFVLIAREEGWIMSYLSHWKLNRSPFSLSGSQRGVFTGGTIEEAIARLDFLADQHKKLGIILGPSGIGKSTLLNYFSAKRNSQVPREQVVLVDMNCINEEVIAARVAAALGITHHGNSDTCWSEVQDFLFSRSSIGHRTILLLDNFVELHDQFASALAKLWCSKAHWSTVVSVDDEAIVNLPRWLIDQCDLKIELPPWDLGQTADYFEFATSREGGREELFDAQSITRIQELSDGIPRRIVQIAGLALVAGAVRKCQRINADLVEQVCEEFTVSVGAKFPTFWAEPQLNAG